MQTVLRPDELLLEIAVAESTSFAMVVTNATARVQPLAGRSTIDRQAADLLAAVRDGRGGTPEANALGSTLLARIPELSSHRRVIVSADSSLQQVPFELLGDPGRESAGPLLDTHVVSYTPSAGVLSMLRKRTTTAAPQMVLAIGSSPDPNATSGASPSGPPTRGVYDVDASHLRPLPLATEEARFVGTAFGERASRVGQR